ncbi:MAG: sigma-54 dependent transcriptional regulator [Proteobacteria bacterium]|nr:sigma-54 dependent transcriptional regulator [Pseudomonadota bacterium]
MENRILVIDDEADFLDTIKRGLIISGYHNIHTENNAETALAFFKNGKKFDAALLDITMPGMDGIKLLEEIKKISPHTECIMLTAMNEAQMAVDCIKKGAYDYLVKPISKNDLLLSLNRALERRRFLKILDLRKETPLKNIRPPRDFSSIITQSPKLIRILCEAELHAASKVPVLITGDSGTGKELLARAIHRASPRASAAFSAINMASMSSTLFDAEFFGHTKGAFTGAQANRPGYLTTTDKGSLFLDEIGSLPLELQGKLLRVLQEGEHLPIGTDTPIKTDIRFIAATNETIENQVLENKFRKDLYYRLKGAWLHLPALKERREDIALLAVHFVEQLGNKPASHKLHPETLSLLEGYPYPGNVRELKSIIQSAFNLSQGQIITPGHLPEHVTTNNTRPFLPGQETLGLTPLSLVEKKHILHVYEHTGRNKSKTAVLLGIGLNTLRRKLKSYRIS